MSDNPFKAPETESLDIPVHEDFKGMRTLTLKRLYHHGRSVKALGYIWILIALFFAIASFTSLIEASGLIAGLIMASISFFMFATAVGVFRYTSWGRICAIVLCCFGLLGFPMGTIVSVFGIIALVQGKALFGHDRLDYKMVTAEYKQRKRK